MQSRDPMPREGGAPPPAMVMPDLLGESRVAMIIDGRPVKIPTCFADIAAEFVVNGRPRNPAELIYRRLSKVLP